jgi:hypothetical protein
MNLFPVIKPLSFVTNAIKAICAAGAHLTTPQQANLALVMSGMILLQTLTISKICMGWLCKRSVSALSHFFNYAGLNGHILMAYAVKVAATIMQLTGVQGRLAIDDTMEHHSRFCRCIKNVYWLFDHVLQANCNAKCLVFAYFVVNEKIRFPIGWRVYRKNGPEKWKLALELIDEALALGLSLEVVLFDSWYCVSGMIAGIKARKLRFISEVKSSHTVEFQTQHGRAKCSIAKLFQYGDVLGIKRALGLVKQGVDYAEKVLYETVEIVAYLRAFEGKFKLVRSVDQRSGACKIFITNELSWEAHKILGSYSYRWLIEEFFKNAKELFGLEKACIRSEQGGALALFLVSFADLLVSMQLWESVHEHPNKRLPTVSAVMACAVEENLKNLLPLIADPVELQKIVEVWQKILDQQKAKVRKERKHLVPVPKSGPSEASYPMTEMDVA